MDRLRAIEIFILVAERQSFRAAAEELKLSRTLISDGVKELEERVGARLLHRTTRRVSLTESGTAFLEKVRAGVAAIEEAEAEAASLTARPRGVLRVNAPLSLGIRHVAPAIGAFVNAHKNVRVELTLSVRFVDLIEENVDVAIRVGRLVDSSLIARKVAASRMVLCASPAYIKAHRPIRHPHDLADHQCLSFAHAAEGPEWSFTRKGESASVRIDGRLSCNNGDALVEAASVGAGIVLQPSFIVAPAIRGERLVKILPAWQPDSLDIHAVFPESRFVPAKTRAFIDHLAKRFAEMPDWDA